MNNPEVIHKNFMALNQFMKDMRKQIDDLNTENQNLRNSLSQVSNQMSTLHQQYAILMARFGGGGSTSGN